MWYDRKNGVVELLVQARPASSRDEIVGIHDGALKIKIKAPAVEGAANKALVKFLAKRFKAPKSEIELIAGATAKRKRICIPETPQLSAFIEEMDV